MGYDNDICGYARISLAYAAGVRVARKFDPETGEYIIDPSTGKPLKDADGNVVIDEATGKPKKDPKTQTPYLEVVNLLELEKLRMDRIKSAASQQSPRSVRCRSRSRILFSAATTSVTV